MSHAKERKEKNCLNCNAMVAGRFCQVCGQENIETHETFGHLAGHFISDIFHFDGQFFSTSKYLLFSPGFLTQEYVRGRRASYLNPIKMYFFISAFFFLFFLGFFKDQSFVQAQPYKTYTTATLISKLKQDTASAHRAMLEHSMPSIALPAIQKKLAAQEQAIAELQKDSSRKAEIYDQLEGPVFFGEKYRTKEEYDSAQKALPEDKRAGWLSRKFTLRNIELGEEFRANGKEAADTFSESIFHHIPQTLFVSLPLFALLLQLLYTRHKKLSYANHAIYTVHLYCALFIFMFAALLLQKLELNSYLAWLQWIRYGVLLYAVYYTFRTLHVYYGQGFGKTLLKWLMLNVAAFIMMSILLVVMVFLSLYTM